MGFFLGIDYKITTGMPRGRLDFQDFTVRTYRANKFTTELIITNPIATTTRINKDFHLDVSCTLYTARVLSLNKYTMMNM